VSVFQGQRSRRSTSGRGDGAGTVLIAGGGASGTLTALNLANAERAAVERVVLVEPRPRVGPGIAYGTTRPEHLLNVPAGGMSAFPDDPDHFLRWAAATIPDVSGASFLPRALYGRYLEEALAEACADGRPGRARIECLTDEVVAIAPGPDGLEASLRSGGTIAARQAVRATGNGGPPSSALAGLGDPSAARVVLDPWDQAAIESLRDARRILVLGAGLTAVDVCLTLFAERSDCAIDVLSRHGLVPLGHRPEGADPRPPAFQPRSDRPRLVELMRDVRREVRELEAGGGDWRDVMNSLRPVTPALWSALGPDDQARFLARVGRYWDVHRHRLAPRVAKAIETYLESDRLAWRAGSLVALSASGGEIRATIRERGSGDLSELAVDALVNCTGLGRISDSDSPLLAQLQRDGLARPDVHGLGFETNADGSLAGEGGRSGLFAIGPLRRGMLLESTAIPEIRVQARELAETLARARAG
jgi:uncharacterized NAD(P)/FAD-binding protein YdhS